MKNLKLLTVIILATLFVHRVAMGANNPNNVTFALNLPTSLLGEGAATIISQLETLRKDAAQKSGLRLTIMPLKSWSEVVNALGSGAADIAWLPPYYYVKAKMRGVPIAPLVTFSSKGKTSSPVCLYAARDTFHNLDQMVDARIAVPDEEGWMMLNKILADEGNPIPAPQFFSDIMVMTRESASYAVVFHKIGGVIMDSLYAQYVWQKDPRFRQMAAVACTRPYPNPPIVYRKNLSAEKLKRARKALLEMHSNPAYRDVRPWFDLTGGRWVETSHAAYGPWVKLFQEANSAGWAKDFRRLTNTND